MYRTCGFLCEVRQAREQRLFDADRDLFSDALGLLFIDILRMRSQVRYVTVVADRGMIGGGTIDLLTKDPDAPFDHILGCRMRRSGKSTKT